MPGIGDAVTTVLALYIVGGEVLEGFAFTMLVGIVSGTYSTVFIASAGFWASSTPTACWNCSSCESCFHSA